MIHRTLPTHLRKGFTLVEMMVAVAVLVVLLVIIAAVTQGTSLAVHQATGKLSTYAAARAAFSTMTQKLGQATLNTYLDYYGTSSDNIGLTVRTAPGSGNVTTTASSFVPVTYGRVSDLQFIVRQNVDSGSGQEVYFQCPAAYSSDDSNYQSTQGLLNACGYYVKYGDNTSFKPSLIGASKLRYRLMQAIEPTDQLQVYSVVPVAGGASWLGNIGNKTGAGNLAPDALPLADNVIALIVWPRTTQEVDPNITPPPAPLTPNYVYDSQAGTAPTGSPPTQALTADQLPPIVQVTMVVIDEASASRPNTQGTVSAALGNSHFTDVTQYTNDLNKLEAALAAAHINFEVLNSSVVMRESKWSQ